MNRPKLTKEIVFNAVKEMATKMNIEPQHVADIYSGNMDGYEIAKKLERDYCYEFCMSDVEELDGFSCAIDEAMRLAEKSWEKENNIKPPLPIGTKITRGIITGIYEYGAASYLVKEDGCTQDGRHLIIKFENAVPV